MTSLRPPGSTQHWLDQIARHAHLMPDRPALVFEGRTTTWADLGRRVSALAGGLADRGVGRGDRVAVLMSNRPEFLEIVLAANALGAIAVPINFRLTSDEVRFILRDSGSAALAADGDLAAVATEVRDALRWPGVLLVTGDANGEFDTLAEGPEREYAVEVSEQDPALIMYTSGTTGRPKGAVLTHLNLAVQVQTLIRSWRIFRGDEINLCTSPMFHIAAIASIVPMIAAGATTVIMPSGRFDPETMLDTLERERITHVFMVPSQWQAVVDVPEAGKRAAHLRVMCWGAAPASVMLLEQMAATFPGVPNVCTFGQTETTALTTVLDGDDAIRKIGSVGRPIPAVDIRIVDDEMNDVPRGEVGEIVYRGPTLMQGYWNLPDASAEAFAGGWFHSGDLVREDEEGFLYVVDRKKDMIISGGENIYCAEVENVLAAHPAIADVAVIGAAHGRWGESPVAVVVPTDPEAPPSLDDVAEWCRTRLAAYKKPTQLLLLDALPRNATSKVLKPVLRQLVAERISATDAP